MRKFLIFLTVTFSALILFFGVSFAYYNTKSFGFDEDAVLFDINESSITYLDMKIYFKDIDEFYEKAGEYLPKEACTMQL